jgi:hypothetical protein
MTARAWIAGSVKKLNDVKSWTGRIHIHKHLFLTQVLELAEVPFQFELYHFGPYSFQVDYVIADMETFGELDKQYSKPGYGPRYFTTDLADAELSPGDEDALQRVADQIRTFNSSDLELIATCLWVERREGETDDQVIIDRVKEIKPKYPAPQIRTALLQSRTVAAQLS